MPLAWFCVGAQENRGTCTPASADGDFISASLWDSPVSAPSLKEHIGPKSCHENFEVYIFEVHDFIAMRRIWDILSETKMDPKQVLIIGPHRPSVASLC